MVKNIQTLIKTYIFCRKYMLRQISNNFDQLILAPDNNKCIFDSKNQLFEQVIRPRSLTKIAFFSFMPVLKTTPGNKKQWIQRKIYTKHSLNDKITINLLKKIGLKFAQCLEY